MTTSKLPKEVTISRSITYSVDDLRNQLMDSGDEMMLAEVLAMFVEWAQEDLMNASLNFKMKDENGTEIPWEDIIGWEKI